MNKFKRQGRETGMGTSSR